MSSVFPNRWWRRTVIRGKGLGGRMGFPTANLRMGSFGSAHEPGVYACRVEYGGKMVRALLHFGVPFTGGNPTLEIHLLDGFQGDLYGQPIRFRVVARIRGLKRFKTAEDLTRQIARDAAFWDGV